MTRDRRLGLIVCAGGSVLFWVALFAAARVLL